ncbi:MAG: hypothetical protein ABI874_01365 [Chloroflexota bacterium]
MNALTAFLSAKKPWRKRAIGLCLSACALIALQFLSVFWLSSSPPTALAGADSYLCGQFVRTGSTIVLRLYTDDGLLLYYDPGYQPTGAPISLLWRATALDWPTGRAINPPADGGDYRVYDMYARNIVAIEALPAPDTIDKAIIGRHRIVPAPKGCVVVTVPAISPTAPPQQTSPATTPIRTPPVETPPAMTPVRTSPAQTPPITTPPPQTTPVPTPRTPPPTTAATLALTPVTPTPVRTAAATPFPTAPPSLTPTPTPPCTTPGCIGDNIPLWCIILLCLLILLVLIILLVLTRRRRASPY